MNVKALIQAAAICALAFAIPANAATTPVPANSKLSGQYIESRTADVYTGPCFAMAEVNLAGKQAVMAWHVDHGTWNNISLDGMSVVAVVRSNSTLGDPYSNPLPAKTLFIVDDAATQPQRDALVQFAQTQSDGLLNDVVAVRAEHIDFATNVGGAHGASSLKAGNLVTVISRAADDRDLLCHNEQIYYPPLAANLTHSMAAVATESAYRGNQLGVTWSESYRRGVFVGSFAE
jgi:Protein of unknown function (DUF1326)